MCILSCQTSNKKKMMRIVLLNSTRVSPNKSWTNYNQPASYLFAKQAQQQLQVVAPFSSSSSSAAAAASKFGLNPKQLKHLFGKCCDDHTCNNNNPHHIHTSACHSRQFSNAASSSSSSSDNKNNKQEFASRQVRAMSPDGGKSGVFEVLTRNREWADSERHKPDFFKPLEEGQHPKYFCISCADSRCPSEKMMGFDPGECFTVRNIANCVTNGDLAINSATQFAVDVLKVENILVVGHRDCGGVKAAMTRQSFGTTIDAWVRNVRDVHRQYIRVLDAIPDPQERLDKLIELHVTEQCVNVFKMGFVQRARRKSRELGLPYSPQIHGLVYDPSTGYLKELDIGLREKAKEYGRVYDVLY
jgi:carbonic anhydrase